MGCPHLELKSVGSVCSVWVFWLSCKCGSEQRKIVLSPVGLIRSSPQRARLVLVWAGPRQHYQKKTENFTFQNYSTDLKMKWQKVFFFLRVLHFLLTIFIITFFWQLLPSTPQELEQEKRVEFRHELRKCQSDADSKTTNTTLRGDSSWRKAAVQGL